MATEVHRPLKVIEFNRNGIWRRRYDFGKQLQDLHINVALLSEINLKSHAKLSLLSGLMASREEEAFPITM
jgi:hypothetical protein